MSVSDHCVCPACHGALTGTASSLHCSSCSLAFPVDHGITDFARGDDYDGFDANTELSQENLAALRNEEVGMRSRIRDFYLPKLLALQERLEERSDGFFAAVISSRVLKHVGVHESSDGGYRVVALPDRDQARAPSSVS